MNHCWSNDNSDHENEEDSGGSSSSANGDETTSFSCDTSDTDDDPNGGGEPSRSVRLATDLHPNPVQVVNSTSAEQHVDTSANGAAITVTLRYHNPRTLFALSLVTVERHVIRKYTAKYNKYDAGSRSFKALSSVQQHKMEKLRRNVCSRISSSEILEFLLAKTLFDDHTVNSDELGKAHPMDVSCLMTQHLRKFVYPKLSVMVKQSSKRERYKLDTKSRYPPIHVSCNNTATASTESIGNGSTAATFSTVQALKHQPKANLHKAIIENLHNCSKLVKLDLSGLDDQGTHQDFNDFAYSIDIKDHFMMLLEDSIQYISTHLIHLNLGTLATNGICRAISKHCTSRLEELYIHGPCLAGDLGIRYIGGRVSSLGVVPHQQNTNNGIHPTTADHEETTGCKNLKILSLIDYNSVSLHTLSTLFFYLPHLQVLDHNLVHEALWLIHKTSSSVKSGVAISNAELMKGPPQNSEPISSNCDQNKSSGEIISTEDKSPTSSYIQSSQNKDSLIINSISESSTSTPICLNESSTTKSIQNSLLNLNLTAYNAKTTPQCRPEYLDIISQMCPDMKSVHLATTFDNSISILARFKNMRHLSMRNLTNTSLLDIPLAHFGSNLLQLELSNCSNIHSGTALLIRRFCSKLKCLILEVDSLSASQQMNGRMHHGSYGQQQPSDGPNGSASENPGAGDDGSSNSDNRHDVAYLQERVEDLQSKLRVLQGTMMDVMDKYGDMVHLEKLQIKNLNMGSVLILLPFTPNLTELTMKYSMRNGGGGNVSSVSSTGSSTSSGGVDVFVPNLTDELFSKIFEKNQFKYVEHVTIWCKTLSKPTAQWFIQHCDRMETFRSLSMWNLSDDEQLSIFRMGRLRRGNTLEIDF